MEDYYDITLGGLPSYLKESARRTLYVPKHGIILEDERIDQDYSDIITNVKEKRRLIEKIIVGGINIIYCSPRQENDERIVLIALNSNPLVLYYLGNSYKDREDIIFPFLKDKPEMYKFVSPRLKSVKEYVLEAVNINGLVLEYVDDNMKDDFDVVYRAVSNNGKALKYASKNKQKDRNIILQAVIENGFAISYASPDIWMKDKEIILRALKTVGARQFIYDIDFSLKDDVNFMLECSKIDSKMLCFATGRVKDILNVNYIKRYVDCYLGHTKEDSRELVTDMNVIISKELDNNKYQKYDEEKKKFIKFVSRYKMVSNDNDDLIYQMLFEKIEYEIMLSIGGFVYSIDDYEYQYNLFLKKIVDVYRFIIETLCYRDNVSSSYYDKLLDSSLLPEDFYRELIELKNKREKARNKYIKTMIDCREKHINRYQIKDPYINKTIDKLMEKYLKKADKLNTYDLLEIEECFNNDLDRVKDIIRVVSRVQELWDKVNMLDRSSIPLDEYERINNKLSVDVVCSECLEMGIDYYLKQLDVLEYKIDNRLFTEERYYPNFYDFYKETVDQYCDSLLEIFEDNNITFIHNLNKDNLKVLHDEFNKFYDKYYKELSNGDLSLAMIHEIKSDLLINQFNILVQGMISENSSSINNGESIILINTVFRDLLDEYRNKLKRVDTKEEIIKLQNSFDELFSIYLEVVSGQCHFFDIADKISYLKNYSFDGEDSHVIILGDKKLEKI